MTAELKGAIDVLVKRIEQKTSELTDSKRMVNSLCREAGIEPRYPDSELAAGAFSGLPSIKASQFYGKTPTIAAREYLDLRAEAVSLEEILEALVRGGFDFEAQGWSETMRLKNLGISMGKNSSIFHRLPNDTWGLTKWYPNIKQKKGPAKANGKANELAEGGESNGSQVVTEAAKAAG